MAYRKAAPFGGSSTATREIAALDFLLNIPLNAEQEIVRAGLEAEQNNVNRIAAGGAAGGSVLGRSGGSLIGGGGGGLYHDRSYSIDEDEKFELDKDQDSSFTSFSGAATGAATAATSTIGLGFGSEHDDNATSWWQPMIRKNKEFFSAEDERIKRRERLELETGKLEAPDESDALSAMEDGNLTHNGGDIEQGKGADDARPSYKNALLSKKVVDAGKTTVGSKNNTITPNLQSKEDLYGERVVFAPGRRLDGYEATLVKIPREEAQTELKTTMRTVVRKAAVREWEREMISSKVNQSRDEDNEQNLLDGRIFFSGMSSYPVAVFSVIKYEPKKEEETRRRQRLEAAGGGGSKFVMPSRDWRGVSYGALLPRVERKNRAFNRLIEQGRNDAFRRREKRLKRLKRRGKRNRQKKRHEHEDNLDMGSSDESYESNTISVSDTQSIDIPLFEHEIIDGIKTTPQHKEDELSQYSTSSSEESTTYYPGFLDDPEMTFGRHRHVMVGDRVTGCVVSSTIHFVSPVDLKADLNKQFRERFEQWEPPKPQRKYIGARVIEGCYTLIDPTECNVQEEETDQKTSDDEGANIRRKRIGSIANEIETIRMPPSLTLSKIRKLKQQALHACIDCNIEVSTVALACVYFERLALDCRVDKSNRRLTFAACLLIAIKINEANIALVNEQQSKPSKKGVGVLKSWIKSRKDGDDFASLLEFFTHEWSLSLKELFAAEFGVFAALNFKLHASPSQVSFHFKRLMKTLEWSSRDYLGKYMYEQWQKCLSQEIVQEEEKEHRQEERKQRKEQKLLQLQHELHMMEEVHNTLSTKESLKGEESCDVSQSNDIATPPRKKSGLGIFNRLRKSSNNLNNLVSPQKLEVPSNDSLMNKQNKTEPRYVKQEFKMVRSKSSQNIV